MKKGWIQKKLYRLAYDRPGIHRKALQISGSLEEVCKLLESVGRRKNNKGEHR